MATFYGTSGNDTIVGGSSPDMIYGYPKDGFPEEEFGDDDLRGGGGNDWIYGGGGNDRLRGDDGNDRLFGGDGNDTLEGGAGNDTYDGGAGDDLILIYGTGDDLFQGGLGTDTVRLVGDVAYQRFILDAAAGIERLDLSTFVLSGTAYGETFDFSGLTSVAYNGKVIDLGAGADVFIGHRGADFVRGGAGDDRLSGGGGNDVLSGGAGSDWFDGGSGDDVFLIDGTASDTFLGGSGTDTVRLEGATARYRLILDAAAGVERLDRAGHALTGSNVADIFDFSGLSAVTGSGPVIDLGNGNDTFTGWRGADAVAGGAGHDILRGGGGDDVLSGGAGDDQLVGGAGADRLTGGAGADRFIFAATSESGLGAARDVIVDFSRGTDRVDLAAIDANTRVSGDQAFRFVGSAAFSGTAGELRFAAGALTGDVNGDGVADFEIALTAATRLATTDLIL